MLNWAGLRYWFLSRTDNGNGWHVAVFGKNGVLLGDEYLGGSARYVRGLVVDSAAQQVRVIGQDGYYTEFSFSTLEDIIPEASLDTGVALSTPTTPAPANAASADVTVELDAPSNDPGVRSSSRRLTAPKSVETSCQMAIPLAISASRSTCRCCASAATA